MWQVETLDAFDEWWQTLTEQEQDDTTAIIELLEEKGAHLPFPFSSGIEGSKFSHMRELRIQSHGEPIRVFYAFDPRRTAILIIGGSKTGKGKRFYKDYIPKADKLFEEHLKSMEG